MNLLKIFKRKTGQLAHFNNLTPAEAERLAILAEEMGESIQSIGKILRHGYDSVNPNTGVNNKEALTFEIADVLNAIDRLTKAGDLSLGAIEAERHMSKPRKLGYLHHQ
jgi:NTP pyrophosphatase (non-canonical NTP hydrolase)